METLITRLRLANGHDDCLCQAAGSSQHVQDHDPYCGFRLMHEAADEIERLQATVREIAAFEGPFLASTAYVMWHKARDAIAVEQDVNTK